MSPQRRPLGLALAPAVARAAPAPERSPEAAGSTAVEVLSHAGGHHRVRADQLASEEPLEIRVAGPGQPVQQVGVTMRTPGHDHELAAGLVFTDGIVGTGEVVGVLADVDEHTGAERCNVVNVAVKGPVDPARLTRRATATAACGLCGKAALADLAVRCEPLRAGPVIDPAVLEELPDRLRSAQRVFASTGGLHATGVFDTRGQLLLAREDVGRHNALDKVIGRGLLDGVLPAAGGSRERIVVVSGRLGFELVQKVAVAGYPIVAAVSAPSSLAVETAERFGVTVVGFLRGATFNVYTHPERLGLAH